MLTENDFASIKTMIDSAVGEIGQMLITGKVVKNDPLRKLIWIAELGDQPIPVVDFKSTVNVYSGSPVEKKTFVAEVVIPSEGETVVIALERGTSRLPRCLGVIQSLEYIRPGDE